MVKTGVTHEPENPRTENLRMDAPSIVEILKLSVPPGSVEPAVAGDGMPTIYVAREHVST